MHRLSTLVVFLVVANGCPRCENPSAKPQNQPAKSEPVAKRIPAGTYSGCVSYSDSWEGRLTIPASYNTDDLRKRFSEHGFLVAKIEPLGDDLLSVAFRVEWQGDARSLTVVIDEHGLPLYGGRRVELGSRVDKPDHGPVVDTLHVKSVAARDGVVEVAYVGELTYAVSHATKGKAEVRGTTTYVFQPPATLKLVDSFSFETHGQDCLGGGHSIRWTGCGEGRLNRIEP